MLKLNLVLRDRLSIDWQIQHFCPIKLEFEVLPDPPWQFEVDSHSPEIPETFCDFQKDSITQPLEFVLFWCVNWKLVGMLIPNWISKSLPIYSYASF